MIAPASALVPLLAPLLLFTPGEIPKSLDRIASRVDIGEACTNEQITISLNHELCLNNREIEIPVDAPIVLEIVACVGKPFDNLMFEESADLGEEDHSTGNLTLIPYLYPEVNKSAGNPGRPWTTYYMSERAFLSFKFLDKTLPFTWKFFASWEERVVLSSVSQCRLKTVKSGAFSGIFRSSFSVILLGILAVKSFI